MTHYCICGHESSPRTNKTGRLDRSPIEAEILARLSAIRERRIELAEELGRLTAEESALNQRLSKIVHRG